MTDIYHNRSWVYAAEIGYFSSSKSRLYRGSGTDGELLVEQFVPVEVQLIPAEPVEEISLPPKPRKKSRVNRRMKNRPF